MATRNDIVKEAKQWIDTVWRHQGRNARGIDCAGLIVVVGHKNEVMNYDCKDYPRNTCRDHFISHFDKFADKKPLKDRQHGDIILFRDGIYACHCGILDVNERGEEFIVHSYHVRRKCVREKITDLFTSKIPQ